MQQVTTVEKQRKELADYLRRLADQIEVNGYPQNLTVETPTKELFIDPDEMTELERTGEAVITVRVVFPDVRETLSKLSGY